MSYSRSLEFESLEIRIALQADSLNVELAELRQRLEELLQRDAIDPSVSNPATQQAGVPSIESLQSKDESLFDALQQASEKRNAGQELSAADFLNPSSSYDVTTRSKPPDANRLTPSVTSSSKEIPDAVEQQGLLSDEALVQYRIEVQNQQGLSVTALEAGETYVANVFVKDSRELIPSEELQGGVFKATADVDFGENAVPVGDVQFGEGFSNVRLPGIVSGSVVRGVSAVVSNLVSPGQQEQFFFSLPFQLGQTSTPSSIQILPSQSDNESALLFGLFEPVPLGNIGQAVFEIPAAQSGEQGVNSDAVPVVIDDVSSPNAKLVPQVPTGLPLPIRFVSLISLQIEKLDRLSKPSQPHPPIANRDSASDWAESDDEEEPELDANPESTDADSSDAGASEPGPGSEGDSGEEESNPEDETAIGLFFDERLFLEGMLVEPDMSPFRLRFQLYSPLPQPIDSKSVSNAPSADANAPQKAFVDITQILRPSKAHNPWQNAVDTIIAEIQRSKEMQMRQTALGSTMTFEIGEHERQIADQRSSDDRKDGLPRQLNSHTDAMTN